jgi:hypothetical protein
VGASIVEHFEAVFAADGWLAAVRLSDALTPFHAKIVQNFEEAA